MPQGFITLLCVEAGINALAFGYDFEIIASKNLHVKIATHFYVIKINEFASIVNSE
jgi:hypothetical protein